MTPADWHRHFYGPTPEQVQAGQVLTVSRESLVIKVAGQVSDLHALGTMVYEALITRDCTWFNGTHASLMRAIRDGHVPAPSKRIPKVMFDQAVRLYCGHTKRRFNDWHPQARTISVNSYVSWLVRAHDVVPWFQLRRDPLTTEAMNGPVRTNFRTTRPA